MNNQELNELKRNRTIPIFDCLYEIDEQLEFYTALGFEITYYQKAPYRFASVKNEFTELSFFGDKNFDIEQKHGGCYIVVSNIDDVYNILKTNLKKYYGKIPTKGIPRISRLNATKIIRELESIQLTLNEKRNVENETQRLLEIKDEILLVV
ncbi:hypothetical protein [Bacillus mycoides]|uniref:hypothetical protein n=1 Tax=Bacillus mycoides TaxID=1405 RepID=UPI0027326C99|nr:hypothetical protein [Bacillus mycoides]